MRKWENIHLSFLLSAKHRQITVIRNQKTLLTRPIQGEEEIKQLTFPSSKEKEEEEIWLSKESVSGNSFHWSLMKWFDFALFSFFFPFRQLRWQNNYAGGFVKRNSNYFGVNIANEPSDTATVRGAGERLAKHTLISHFLLTRSGKEGERETEKKRHRGIREQPQ